MGNQGTTDGWTVPNAKTENKNWPFIQKRKRDRVLDNEYDRDMQMKYRNNNEMSLRCISQARKRSKTNDLVKSLGMSLGGCHIAALARLYCWSADITVRSNAAGFAHFQTGR